MPLALPKSSYGTDNQTFIQCQSTSVFGHHRFLTCKLAKTYNWHCLTADYYYYFIQCLLFRLITSLIQINQNTPYYDTSYKFVLK